LGGNFRGQFYKPLLRGVIFSINFWEQLSESLCRIALGTYLANRFAESQLWVTALENSFGEQFWGAALDNFEDYFEEQQLLGTHLQGILGSNFQ